MPRIKHSALVLLLLLVLPTAAAFGYLPAQTDTSIYPGETARFTIYLFGTAESVKVTTTDIPEGWDVKVKPDRVNVSVNEGARYMETADGYRKIIPVQVNAESPVNANGAHTLMLALLADKTQHGNGSSVAIRQVHEVPLTANVVGTARSSGDHEETPGKTTGGRGIGIIASDKAEEPPESTGGLSTLVVAILLFEIMWGIAVIYVWKRRQ